MSENMNTQQENTAEAMPIKLDVRVRTVTPKNNLLAFANVVINDSCVVEGFKICTSDKGLFVNMPSALDKNGEWRDTFKPITADFRNQITQAILDGYDTSIEKMQTALDAAANTTRREAPEKSSLMGQLNAAKETQAQQPVNTTPARAEGAR